MTDWTPIPGFPSYDADRAGQLRTRRRNPPRLLRPCLGDRGYLVVNVRDEHGRKRNMTVHSLVGFAFLGPMPAGMCRNHKDGNKLNNAADNLEYTTQAENVRHAIRLGLSPKPPVGDRAYATRYSFADCQEMRAMRKAGHKLREIAGRFGASVVHVCEICTGKQRATA